MDQTAPYVGRIALPRPAIAGLGKPTSWTSLFLVPALIFVLRFIPGLTGETSYFLTAAYALLGRRQAVVSLLIVSLLNNATHALAGPPTLAALTRHLVVLAAMLSVFFVHRMGIYRRQCVALAFGSAALLLTILIHSLLVSQFPLLSSLKLVSFAMAFLTILVGVGGLPERQRQDLETQVLGIAGALAVLSTPMVATSKGYLLGIAGFCGLISHSQAFGVMMALVAVVSWMNVLTQRRFRIWLMLVAATATALMVLSRARIGGVALAAGLMAGIALPAISTVWDRWRGQPRVLVRRIGPMIAIGVLGLAVAGPSIYRGVSQYLVKYGEADDTRSVTDALWISRNGLLMPMMQSIERRPLTGIGFGVPSDEGRSGGVVEDPIFKLPIMATIEKGVLPVALVEELGYPLAIIVLAWFAWLFWAAAKGGAVSVAAATTAFMVNVAEAIFFSPGGIGLFSMVFLGLAVTSAPFNTNDTRKSLF